MSPSKKKIKNSDFWRGGEKTRVSIFRFEVFGKVEVSPESNVAGSEIHTIVTYDHETHFDVNKKKIWMISLVGIKF